MEKSIFKLMCLITGNERDSLKNISKSKNQAKPSIKKFAYAYRYSRSCVLVVVVVGVDVVKIVVPAVVIGSFYGVYCYFSGHCCFCLLFFGVVGVVVVAVVIDVAVCFVVIVGVVIVIIIVVHFCYYLYCHFICYFRCCLCWLTLQ